MCVLECVSGWWAVELPGPLCKEQCIEVRLGESRVGSGTVVPAFRCVCACMCVGWSGDGRDFSQHTRLRAG